MANVALIIDRQVPVSEKDLEELRLDVSRIVKAAGAQLTADSPLISAPANLNDAVVQIERNGAATAYLMILHRENVRLVGDMPSPTVAAARSAELQWSVGRMGSGHAYLERYGQHFPARVISEALREVLAPAIARAQIPAESLLGARLVEDLGRTLSDDDERNVLLAHLVDLTKDLEAAERRIEQLERELHSLRDTLAESPSSNRTAVLTAIAVVVAAVLNAGAIAYSARVTADGNVKVAQMVADQPAANPTGPEELAAVALALAECQAAAPPSP